MATGLRRSRGLKRGHALFWLVLLAAGAVLVAGDRAQSAFTPPVEVMPLGDSITDGYNVPGGYRIDLEDDLIADGASFDFVGSLSNGPPQLADREHEGHSGWRIDQIHDSIIGWLTTSQPEVVLLMIGTNDIYQNTDLANAPARLGALIDRIHTARPQTHVVVASIAPFTDPTDDSEARAFNAAIPGLVSARAGQGRPVSFADVYSALTPADLADGVHPNAAGYSKIAEVWRAALRPVLGLGGAPTVALTSPAEGAAFAHDAAVPLAATASDTDGIARVEFLDGTTVIGSDSTAPYALSWANPPAGGHTLRARAVDAVGLSGTSAPVSIVVAAAPGEVLYRINVGGPAVAGSPQWAADTTSNPSPYVSAGTETYATTATVSLTHSSLPAGTPEAIFRDERWDPGSTPEMKWTLPVTPGTYDVRLFFAEIYSGAFAVGARRFDVLLENGLVLDDYDVYADAGANRGVMKSFTVQSDSTIDIDFRHVVENPAVDAIEIVGGAATGGDATPPTISARTPADGAGGVSVDTVVTTTFSEPMDPASIGAATFSLAPAAAPASPVSASVAYDAASRSATLDPSAALTPGTSYVATVKGGPGGAKDLAGNPLAADVTWTFGTAAAAADATPPTVTQVTPAAGAKNVSSNATVVATFSEPIASGSVTTSSFTLVRQSAPGTMVPASVVYDAATRTARLTPSSSLAANAGYTATVKAGPTGIRDVAGNALQADRVWSFTTKRK